MLRRDRDRDILWQSSGLSFLAFASIQEAAPSPLECKPERTHPWAGTRRSHPLRVVPAVAQAPGGDGR